MKNSKTNSFAAALTKEEMKKGNITYIRTSISRTQIYKDLREAFIKNKNYLQVFAGLNHNRRDLLVVDRDDIFSPEEAKNVMKYCLDNNIPEPSYIEIHNDSQHWQIGWWLKEYFKFSDDKRHKEYLNLIRKFSEVFNGDKNYTGGWIKNPYNDSNILYEFNEDKIDPKQLIQKFQITSEAPKKPKVKKSSDKKPNNIFGTRNVSGFNVLREWIWEYKRDHKKFPSMKICIEKLTEIELNTETGKKYGPENLVNIEATAKSVLDWTKKEYSTEYHPCQELGNLTKQVKKAINYFKIQEIKEKNPKIKQKEIAKDLRISQGDVSKIVNCDKLEMKEIIYKFLKARNNIEKYDDLRAEARKYLYY